MRNDYYSNSNDYINRWIVSYADFVTMLLALFMIMFATSHFNDTKIKDINNSIQKVFSTQNNQQENTQKTLEENKTVPPNVKNVEINESSKNLLFFMCLKLISI